MSGDDIGPLFAREDDEQPDESGEHEIAEVVPIRPDLSVRRDDRETIDVGDELQRICAAALRAMARDPGIYHRDGQLVHVVHVGASEATDERPEGTPEIRELSAHALAVRLAALARWVSYGAKGTPRTAHPPERVCRALCDFGQWRGLRRLEGIIETPTLRPDGTVIEAPGYDRTTALLFAPSEPYPPLPQNPTQADARRAMLELIEPFEDFRRYYADPAHLAVPLAAILTLLARPAIRGAVPAFIFDASDRGAGKSLHVQTISRIATGRWSRPRVFPASEGSVNEEELAKVLGSIAAAGRSLVDFDNVRCTVDGAPLLAALTTVEQQEFRILGQSRDALLVWRAVVCIGGNNLAIGDEMSRRALLARIEPEDERHELRADLPREKGGYLHPRLREWVAAERPRLVAAALTVLRAWFAAGRPKMGAKTKASFEEWSDIIPHVILWAGGPDVGACSPSQAAEDEDPGKTALRALLAAWGRLAPPEGMTARAMIDALYPGGRRPRTEDGPPDEQLDAARDAIESLTRHRNSNTAPSSALLGAKLKSFKGTKLGGRCLVPGTKSHSAVRWRTK